MKINVKYHFFSYILLAYGFIISLSMFSLMPFFVLHFGEQFGVSSNAISTMLAVSIAIGATIALLVSIFSTSSHLRLMLVLSACGFITSIALFLVSISINNLLLFFISLLLLRLSLALGTNVTRAIHVIINSNIDKADLYAYMSMTFGLGSALGPLIGSLFFKYLDLNWLLIAIIAISIPMVICTISCLCGSKLVIEKNSVDSKVSINWHSIMTYLNERKNILLICVVCYALIGQSISFIPLKINKITIGSDIMIGGFFFLNSLILIGTPLIMKYISNDKLRQKVIMVICLTISLILFSLGEYGVWSIFVSCLLFSVGEAIVYSIGMDSFLSRSNLSNTTSMVAIFNFLTLFIGTNLGQLFGTFLFNRSSYLIEIVTWIGLLVILIALIMFESKCRSDHNLIKGSE